MVAKGKMQKYDTLDVTTFHKSEKFQGVLTLKWQMCFRVFDDFRTWTWHLHPLSKNIQQSKDKNCAGTCNATCYTAQIR